MAKRTFIPAHNKGSVRNKNKKRNRIFPFISPEILSTIAIHPHATFNFMCCSVHLRMDSVQGKTEEYFIPEDLFANSVEKFMQSITEEEKDRTNNLVAATKTVVEGTKRFLCSFLCRYTPLNSCLCSTQLNSTLLYSFKRSMHAGEYSIAAQHPPGHLFRSNSRNNISSPFVVWKIEWEIEYT